MSNEPTQLRFDYEALDADTRRYVMERAERIHNLARMTAAGIVQIGQYLMEVKERLKHGQFLDWIDAEFAWAERSVRRFMEVYEAFKSANLADMQIDVSALYLIAAPKIPEPARAEVIRRAENGEKVTHEGARALVKRFEETGEIPNVEVSLPRMIEERRQTLLTPSPPPPRKTAEERAEEERQRQIRERNTAKAAALMGVVASIETIVKNDCTIIQLARHIERFDTPDQDWRGKVHEAWKRLGELWKELKS